MDLLGSSDQVVEDFIITVDTLKHLLLDRLFSLHLLSQFERERFLKVGWADVLTASGAGVGAVLICLRLCYALFSRSIGLGVVRGLTNCLAMLS